MPGKTGLRRVDYQARRLPEQTIPDENSGGLVRSSLSYRRLQREQIQDAITGRDLNACLLASRIVPGADFVTVSMTDLSRP